MHSGKWKLMRIKMKKKKKQKKTKQMVEARSKKFPLENTMYCDGRRTHYVA